MNGIQLMNKVNLKNSKKIESIKTIIVIITTNLLSISICLILPPKQMPILFNTAKDGHTFIEIEGQTFISNKDKQKILPVSIYNKEKKLIIHKAYLHSSTGNQGKNINLEIKNDDLNKIIKQENHSVLVFPYFKKKAIAKKEERQYEIIF
jgi:hypothetical protein